MFAGLQTKRVTTANLFEANYVICKKQNLSGALYQVQSKSTEKLQIYTYLLTHGTSPIANKITR